MMFGWTVEETSWNFANNSMSLISTTERRAPAKQSVFEREMDSDELPGFIFCAADRS